MKKCLLLIVASIVVQTSMAQTNFRIITFNQALLEAKAEAKQVFIDFYTDWCGPCKRMSREVFPSERVGIYMNQHFVSLQLNAEKEGKDLAETFKVDAYPTFILLDSSGKEKGRIVGSMDRDRFLMRLEELVNPEKSPENIKRRFLAGDRTPSVVKYYISLQRREGDYEGTQKLINNYFNSLSDVQRLAPENLFLFIPYTTDLNDVKGKFMLEHRNEFDASVRQQVLGHIEALYRIKLSSYLSGYQFQENRFKKDEYQALKLNICKLGTDMTQRYSPVFRLIEGREMLNDNDFIDLCTKEYKLLEQRDKNLLIMNLLRLVETKDVSVLKKLSLFIRSNLAEMPPVTVSAAGNILETIEDKMP